MAARELLCTVPPACVYAESLSLLVDLAYTLWTGWLTRWGQTSIVQLGMFVYCVHLDGSQSEVQRHAYLTEDLHAVEIFSGISCVTNAF